MRRERVAEKFRLGDDGPVIIPFASPPHSSPPQRSSIAKNVTREFRRLLDQARPGRIGFTCAWRWNQWRRWCHWVARPHTPFQAVFVVASPRSGSNLLVDYLQRLPGVKCLSEVLNWGMTIGPKKLLHPQQVVRHLQQSLQTLQAQRRGCKIFLHELEHYRLSLDDLEQAFPSVRYLLLYRENLAEQFVSAEAAKQTQQWILLPGQQRKKVTVTVDPNELSHYCQEMQRIYANIATSPAIARHGAIISYEELVTNSAHSLREVVCPHLGVPYIESQTGLRKQSVESLADRVTNYSDVASLLHSPLCRLQLRSNLAAEQRPTAA